MKCEFCQGSGYIEDEYGEWKLEAVKLTPLPPVILSGDPDPLPYHAEAPYWALFMKYLDEDHENGEKASFPINFCPVCGRNLNDIKITVFADGAAAANALRKRKEKTNE